MSWTGYGEAQDDPRWIAARKEYVDPRRDDETSLQRFTRSCNAALLMCEIESHYEDLGLQEVAA